MLWSIGTDHGTWAAIHTDAVVALGIGAVVHLAIYTRKAFRASATSLESTQVTQPERLMVWALVVALLAGGAAIGLEPMWNPSSTPPHAGTHQR